LLKARGTRTLRKNPSHSSNIEQQHQQQQQHQAAATPHPAAATLAGKQTNKHRFVYHFPA